MKNHAYWFEIPAQDRMTLVFQFFSFCWCKSIPSPLQKWKTALQANQKACPQQGIPTVHFWPVISENLLARYSCCEFSREFLK